MKKNLFIAGLSFSLLITGLKLPEWHNNKLRNKVQSKIVKVTNSQLNSGGTGFYVKGKSGKTYIMTNAHVCEVGTNGIVYIFDENKGRAVPKRILEESSTTDLCLIEGISDVEGLELADEYHRNQDISIFGYPGLLDKVKSSGEIFDHRKISVLDFFIMNAQDYDRCNLPKQSRITIDLGFFKMQACIVTVDALGTNAIILPGNSGSPAVDYYGNIIGVAFAGNSANWGYLIPLEQVRKFLEPY